MWPMRDNWDTLIGEASITCGLRFTCHIEGYACITPEYWLSANPACNSGCKGMCRDDYKWLISIRDYNMRFIYYSVHLQ